MNRLANSSEFAWRGRSKARLGLAVPKARFTHVGALHAIALVLAWLSAGLAPGAAHAQTQAADFVPKARQVVLMDADSGAILYQHNADQLAAPASMSKLMTLAVAFKLLKSGKLNRGDEFVMSVNAWRRGGAPSGTSAMMVPVNAKVRLDELLQGIVVQSGNDASISVAEGIAGSEDAFAKVMTEEARRIGMPKSQFRNPTGLYHPDHLMTAKELAILARYIMREYPDYFPLFSQKEFVYRRHKFVNKNPLLFADPTVDGMKTGYVKQAGYGMVVTSRQNERRLIAVVNGAASDNERKDEVKRLLDWGYKNVSEFKIYEATEVIGQARVWGGSAFYVPLVGNGDISIWLPRFPAGQRLKGEIVYASPLKAPIQKGTEVAKLRVTSSTSAMQEVPLYAAESVDEGGLMRRGLDSLAHLAFRWVPR